MNSIYLVEKYWERVGSRNGAWGYEPVGYVHTKEEIAPLLERKITGTGFPISRGQVSPEYKLSLLNKVMI